MDLIRETGYGGPSQFWQKYTVSFRQHRHMTASAQLLADGHAHATLVLCGMPGRLFTRLSQVSKFYKFEASMSRTCRNLDAGCAMIRYPFIAHSAAFIARLRAAVDGRVALLGESAVSGRDMRSPNRRDSYGTARKLAASASTGPGAGSEHDKR